MMLPTSLCSPMKRLQVCQKAFNRVKTTGFLKFLHIQAVQAAMLPIFIAKYSTFNYYHTLGFTNIAGDEDGFFVQNLPCSGFEMSVVCPGYSGKSSGFSIVSSQIQKNSF